VKLLDRYLLRELVPPFLFGVAAFTIVFLAANVLFTLTELLAQGRIGLWEAAKLLVFSMPWFMRFTFPMAMLLGGLLSLSRLSGEQETVAMAAGGVSFARLMVPFALAGCVVSVATLAFDETVSPAADAAAQRILAAAGESRSDSEGVVLPGYQDGRLVSLLHAARLNVREGTMRDLILVVGEPGRPRMVVSAKSARWRGRTWRFYDGKMMFPLDEMKPTVSFGRKGIEMDVGGTPKEIAQRERKPSEMTWRELRAVIARLQTSGAPSAQIAQMVWELHNKIAVPFASLVFGLLAAPLAIRPQRSSRAWGFGISLLVIFVYYVIWSYLQALAEGQVVPPWTAAWAPNVMGLFVAAGLIVRQSRR
jgi:lipopolysaccharide export system permease protein